MKINKKFLIFTAVACVLLFAVMMCIFVLKQINYSDYEKVEARIVSVDSKYGSGSNSKSRTYYVTYQYKIEGEQYNSKTQVFTKSGKKIDDIVVIRYNPENPSEIENEYANQSLLFFIIFTGVFTVLLWIIILRNKRF